MTLGVSTQNFRPAVDGRTRKKSWVQVYHCVVEMIAPVACPEVRNHCWYHVDCTVEGSKTSRDACLAATTVIYEGKASQYQRVTHPLKPINRSKAMAVVGGEREREREREISNELFMCQLIFLFLTRWPPHRGRYLLDCECRCRSVEFQHS